MKIILQDIGVLESDVSENAKELVRRDANGERLDGTTLLSPEVALDDTGFDVPGWISLEVGGVSVASIHINDLYPAAMAFQERHRKSLES